MSSKKYAAIKREKLTSKKRKYGTSSFKLSGVSRLCTIGKYYIEI
jgi:hypothetical protein